MGVRERPSVTVDCGVYDSELPLQFTVKCFSAVALRVVRRTSAE